MRPAPIASTAILLVSALVAAPAAAHRLDEYLQDTTIDVKKDRVALQLRLTPGVQVLPALLPAIDTNADGVLSDAEQRAYDRQVLRDLALTSGGDPVPLRLVSSTFPRVEDMREGLGEIVLDLEAPLPARRCPDRRLTLENRHQRAISAYLVNCLSPTDPSIRVVAQHRNYEQSSYQLDYTQPAAAGTERASWPTLRRWLIADGVALLALVAFLWKQWRRRRGTKAPTAGSSTRPPPRQFRLELDAHAKAV
jgi:hypothetical protein